MPEPEYRAILQTTHTLNDLDGWEAEYAAEGVAEAEALLAKHAGFHDYLAEQGQA